MRLSLHLYTSVLWHDGGVADGEHTCEPMSSSPGNIAERQSDGKVLAAEQAQQ